MTGSIENSETLFSRATQLMPGGVSSPVRAFRHVGGTPIYFKQASGSRVVDEDGNNYIDFCLGWGPLILGHAHENVVFAVTRAAKDGLTFGTCHRNEIELAELILEAYQPFENVRFVVSGTEAVMTAVRLARAATGRSMLIKFSGCYHGHGDALLAKAGSGVVTQGLAESDGVSNKTIADTLVLPLGDSEALKTAFAQHGANIAACIVEPLPANNGLLVQSPEWLRHVRTITTHHGALLVFDEVISGFRFGFHGYGNSVEVQPDLVTLGKIIGGGLPVGAVVGPSKILQKLAPLGGVYQAGTMAGNPVALSAGVATLKILQTQKPYAYLTELGTYFDEVVQRTRSSHLQWQRVGSIFWPYFDTSRPIPTQAEQISSSAIAVFKEEYRRWLGQGIYLPPSAYEVGFLSTAHSKKDVEMMINTVSSVTHA